MWLEYENSNTQLSDFNDDDDEDFKLKFFFCGIIPQNQYDNNMIIAFTSAAYCIFSQLLYSGLFSCIHLFPVSAIVTKKQQVPVGHSNLKLYLTLQGGFHNSLWFITLYSSQEAMQNLLVASVYIVHIKKEFAGRECQFISGFGGFQLFKTVSSAKIWKVI